LHATRRRGGAELRQLAGSTGMRLGRMWSALIVVQVAFAVAFLPTAIKSGLTEIRTNLTRPNYPVEEFVSAGISTGSASNPLGNRLLELRRRLQAEPEVAGVTFAAPQIRRYSPNTIEIEGLPREDVEGVAATTRSAVVTTFGIDSDYLDVYGLRLVAGRAFNT